MCVYIHKHTPDLHIHTHHVCTVEIQQPLVYFEDVREREREREYLVKHICHIIIHTCHIIIHLCHILIHTFLKCLVKHVLVYGGLSDRVIDTPIICHIIIHT